MTIEPTKSRLNNKKEGTKSELRWYLYLAPNRWFADAFELNLEAIILDNTEVFTEKPCWHAKKKYPFLLPDALSLPFYHLGG